jgi:hypothetical protein
VLGGVFVFFRSFKEFKLALTCEESCEESAERVAKRWRKNEKERKEEDELRRIYKVWCCVVSIIHRFLSCLVD